MLWAQSVENRAALRTAIAALIAILISFTFHLDTPYWSGMSVVIVANLYVGSIIDKALMRIIGTVAGAVVGYYIAGMVANSFFLYLLSCFLIVCVGAYYYSFSIHGYAYLLGALCAFIIISNLAFTPQNAFFVAIWRPVEIGIGVLVSAISAYSIFPNHLKDNVFTQTQALFSDFVLQFQEMSQGLAQGAFDFDQASQSNLKIKRKIRKAVELIGAMNYELGVTQERTDQLRALLEAFYDLTRQLQYLIIISPSAKSLDSLRTFSTEKLFTAVQEDLLQLQHAFVSQSTAPVHLQVEGAIKVLSEKLPQKEINKLRHDDFLHSLMHFFHHVARQLSLIKSLLAHLPIASSSRFKVVSTQDRLRTDPDLIKRSIKAGLSVVLALGFWLTSNWPGGINGIISSLIISIRKNLFEMKNVSFHRLLGCLLGGGTALFSLFFIEMDLYDLIIVLFFSIWAFTYFMFKFPKYSYIGLQANIALIISLAQEGGPPVDLAPPLQRLGGIVIGIAASFMIANLVWRSDVWTMLNRYLQKLHTYMGYNLQQAFLAPEGQKSIHELANLFWLSRSLLETLADETLNAKKQQTLNALTKRFESLVMMQAVISHILMTADHQRVQKIAQWFAFDLGFYEREVLACFKEHDPERCAQTSNLIQDFLSKIENTPSGEQGNSEDLHVFLAYVNALNQLLLRIAM